MPREALRKNIHELREQLASGQPLTPEQRRSLDAALDEIEPLIDPESESDEHDTLADRLRELASHFEDTHVDLTLAVGRVADALSRLGI